MENKDISGRNFNKILQMVSLNNFALAFVSVFIPIFLLQLGYSFQMVMLWMIIHHATLLVSAFLAVYVSNRIGLVHTLHIRFAFLLASLLLLLTLKNVPAFFYIVPILTGIESAFFWMPLNILFVRNTKADTMGSSMSKFFVIPKIISIASPIIGAFIVTRFGFPTLFVFAMLLLFFVFLPVLSLRSEKTNFIFSWQKAREIFRNNKQYFVPEVIDNLAEDAMVLWIIFIYLKLASVVQVGIIGAITAVVAVFFTLSLGRLTDKWNKHKLLKIGAALVSLVWLINFAVGEFIPNQWLFYIATVFASFALKVFLIPYSSLMFNRARKDDAQFIVLREVPTVLGRLILFTIAILLSSQLPILFLVIGLLFVYFWFLNTKKLE